MSIYLRDRTLVARVGVVQARDQLAEMRLPLFFAQRDEKGAQFPARRVVERGRFAFQSFQTHARTRPQSSPGGNAGDTSKARS